MKFHPGQKVTVTFPADWYGFSPKLAGKKVSGIIERIEFGAAKIELESGEYYWHSPISDDGITVEPAGTIAAQEGQP